MADIKKSVVSDWIWQIAVKKAVVTVCQVVVAWWCAQGLDKLFGITIDPVQLSLGLLALLEIARNWIKVKFKWTWL